jgi:prepilin peptidase CpaA
MLMRHPFFPPEPIFAWTFCAALVLIAALAAYLDLRQMRIPKALTLTGLGLGVLMNLVRGAWLGATGEEVWRLGANGGFLGALDGVLFSLAGFAAGFALFFIMWVLGTCGGGDVKLFAALGAWIGAYLVLFLLMGTILLVCVFTVFRLVGNVVRHGLGATIRQHWQRRGVPQGKRRKERGGIDPLTPRGRLLTYSLPAALSTVCILLWFFRAELGLVPNQATGDRAAASQVALR